MDINEIKKLIKVVENSKITEFSIHEGDLKIKISKNGTSNKGIIQQSLPVESPILVSSPEASPSETSEKAESKSDDNFHVVNSPIVGTFYRAPGPDADPYVQIGDSVNSGSILCIVEAMKLMNEIECDIDGKIVEILVENGTPVEFNQPLFKIEKN